MELALQSGQREGCNSQEALSAVHFSLLIIGSASFLGASLGLLGEEVGGGEQTPPRALLRRIC